MFGNNFTELDEDFITLYSKINLTKNITLKDFEYLEKLAEMGQVQAQQIYYSLLNNGVVSNKIIDDMVDAYDNSSSSQIWAKLYKACFEENFFDTAKLAFDNSERYLFEAYSPYVQKTIKEYKSFYLFCQTKQACLDDYLKTKNPLDLERYYSLATKFYVPETLQEFSFFRKNCSKLQNDLAKAYNAEPSSSRIAYSYGMHLYNFNPCYYVFSHVKKGEKILSELAKRPYSKPLQDYQLKGKTVGAEEKEKTE